MHRRQEREQWHVVKNEEFVNLRKKDIAGEAFNNIQ